ncbi:2-furoyl-CoA dehydrogenase 2Fe-2S iron sulfur subunit [Azospirillum sp. OGB3]|uniref:(2Fe-2S)-binding protein n=1 Tax=Azospirillum sp. OGB3 TaxID=2587012 RepID=UPI001606E06F|nr:(2Fe-2S)-binding protein [Azospirillum sp. OGB3]MBB3268409.1 2-furoyl-CoA dehydrogenase 2Fe-2S iron sulfur subunit [Azospirillum sp. OGB3]
MPPLKSAVTLAADARHTVTIVLNGAPRTGQAHPRLLLSDFLRHELGAHGTRVGCEHGVCGACTVRIDGVAQRACLTLAVQADGRRIDTVEGLSQSNEGPNQGPNEGRMTALQEAFRRHHALQCGFCTAGILMSLSDYLGRNPKPTEEELRDMLSGHLCRCTGYAGIVRAVMDVTGQTPEPGAMGEAAHV